MKFDEYVDFSYQILKSEVEEALKKERQACLDVIDKKIVIDINEPNEKFEKIFENSKRVSNKLLKNEFNT